MIGPVLKSEADLEFFVRGCRDKLGGVIILMKNDLSSIKKHKIMYLNTCYLN